MNKHLQQMEAFARQNKIPVVLPETREFLCSLVKKNKPKTILEIGMAIGFSASCMLLSNENSTITELEASVPNIALAKQNFEALGLTDRVSIIEGDCLKTLPKLVEQNKKFDMIFLDGPKGFYVDMIEPLKNVLKPNGVWVTDNVLFRGMVRGGAQITENRYIHTVETLRNFLNILENDKTLNTQVLEIGDGLCVVTKKEN